MSAVLSVSRRSRLLVSSHPRAEGTPPAVKVPAGRDSGAATRGGLPHGQGALGRCRLRRGGPATSSRLRARRGCARSRCGPCSCRRLPAPALPCPLGDAQALLARLARAKRGTPQARHPVTDLAPPAQGGMSVVHGRPPVSRVRLKRLRTGQEQERRQRAPELTIRGGVRQLREKISHIQLRSVPLMVTDGRGNVSGANSRCPSCPRRDVARSEG
jgi:hypothetical protein